MRCFIGIPLPVEIRDYLFTLQSTIGQYHAKIHWIAKKNLHITLKFLGYPDEETLRLTRTVLRSLKQNSFTVDLHSLGCFPSFEKPRVIWVDLSPQKELMELHGDIELGLGSLFLRDERFAVHLTLGRVKLIVNNRLFLDFLNNIHLKKCSFSITEFCLIQSVLSKDGPRYQVLETYPLQS